MPHPLYDFGRFPADWLRLDTHSSRLLGDIAIRGDDLYVATAAGELWKGNLLQFKRDRDTSSFSRLLANGCDGKITIHIGNLYVAKNDQLWRYPLSDIGNPVCEAQSGWDGCIASHADEIHIATWEGRHNKANICNLSDIRKDGGGWTGHIAIEQHAANPDDDRIFLARRANGSLQVKPLSESGTTTWAYVPRYSSIAIYDRRRWLIIATADGVYSGSLQGSLENPTIDGYPDEFEQWPEPRTYYGPIIGSVTDNSAKFWIYTSRERVSEIRCRKAGSAFGSPVALKPNSRIVLSQQATVTGLEADQAYEYEINIGTGSESELVSGRFVTAPAYGPTSFTMAFSSCSDRQSSFVSQQADIARQPTWEHFTSMVPRLSFHMLIGDTIYLPWTSVPNERPPVHRHIWRLHMRQRAVKSWQSVVRTIPTFVTWDDHDFGENNSDSTQKHKPKSLNAFRELFPNPDKPITDPDFDGIHYSFSWGDVEFFVPDGRYHRIGDFSGRPSSEWKILGDDQMSWLTQALSRSKATFKVIVSGSTWVHPGHRHKDSWADRPNAQKAIIKSMETTSGIVFLSGDLHICRIRKADKTNDTFNGDPLRHNDGYPYPLYEFISSGIARPASSVYGEIFETSTFKGSLTAEQKKDEYGRFVTVEFDTTQPDPVLTARVMNRNGKEAQDQSPVIVHLSELQP